MPSRAYNSFLRCAYFESDESDLGSVNALSGLYLISTSAMIANTIADQS